MTKKILQNSASSKGSSQDEDVPLPEIETIRKLDTVATTRLSELSGNATPVERDAVAKLIGNQK